MKPKYFSNPVFITWSKRKSLNILWQNKWYQNPKTHACFPSKCVFFKNRGLQQLRISLQQNDDLAHNKRYIKKLEAAILCWKWFLDSLRLRFYGACLKSIQIRKKKSGFSSKHVISRSLTLKNIVDMLKWPKENEWAHFAI